MGRVRLESRGLRGLWCPPRNSAPACLANAFAGTLNARTVVRYGAYPDEVSVRDTLGTTRPDNNLTFIGGRIVAFFDTIASTNDGPVTLALGGLQQEWDVSTVTWETAVDTINDNRSWDEAGAGPVADLGTIVWDPAEGDSVWFELDSAAIASMADTAGHESGRKAGGALRGCAASDPPDRIAPQHTSESQSGFDVLPSLRRSKKSASCTIRPRSPRPTESGSGGHRHGAPS